MGVNSSFVSDEGWMRYALRMAQRAEQQGEVPVGAVLVKDNVCIAEAWNQPIALNDPSAHAEIQALRLGGQALNNYRLPGCVLYVTLEPCVMCMGAIAQARISRLVFGAYDEQRGAVCSRVNLAESGFLNHKTHWQGGLLQESCSLQLKTFFKAKRNKYNAKKRE